MPVTPGLTRQTGQLYETQTELAPSRATAPVTPRGVAAGGGSPDQAKMAGTPAQKAPVLAAAVKPAKTKAAAEVAATAAEQQQLGGEAAAKADRLRALGSLGSRVEALIQQRISAATTTAPSVTVSDSALAGIQDPEKRAAAKTALEAYQAALTSGNQAAAETALQQVVQATGQDVTALTGGGLRGYFTEASQAFSGTKVATTAPTLAELAAVPGQPALDLDQLATDLGVTADVVRGMTLDQAQQAVADVAAREFATVAALKVEFATASPQRKAQLAQQLRQLSTVAATEAAVQDLNTVMERGEEIMFAGERKNVRDILADEDISKTIMRAVNSAESLAALATTEPTLAKWITDNKASLAQLATDMETSAAGFQAVQATAAETLSQLTPEQATALGVAGVGGPMTSAQVEAAKAKLEGSPLYQAAFVGTDAVAKALRAAVTSDPTLFTTLAGKTPEELGQIVSQYRDMTTASPELKRLAGWPEGGSWDAGRLAEAARWAGPYNAMGVYAEHPEIKRLIGEGQIKDPRQLETLRSTAQLLQGADANTKKLLGFDKPKLFSTYTIPGKEERSAKHDSDMVKEMRARVEAYKALPVQLRTSPNVATLIADHTIRDPEQLKLLASNPQAADEIMEMRHERAIETALSRTVGVTPEQRNDAFAKELFAGLPGFEGKSFSELRGLVARATDAVQSKSATEDTKARARQFLDGAGQFLDVNKDGRVDDSDFYTGGLYAEKQRKHLHALMGDAGRTNNSDLLSGKKTWQSPFQRFREWLGGLGDSGATKTAFQARVAQPTGALAASTAATQPAEGFVVRDGRVVWGTAAGGEKVLTAEEAERVKRELAGAPTSSLPLILT